MLSFYWRLVSRQARLPAIRLFTIAVALASAVTLSITLLSDRLEQLLEDQSREVLGADLLFESTQPATVDQLAIFDQLAEPQERAETINFSTMASSEDGFLLSGIKAVTDNYPLKGELQVSDALYGGVYGVKHGPKVGEVWLEDRVFNELDIAIGDTITVGELDLVTTKVLVYEPDRGGSFYSFTPRVLMNAEDVARTGVVQVGSRVTYGYLFNGPPSLLAQLEERINEIIEPNQKFVSVESANETLAATLDRAYQFLHIAALIAVLLGAVGVALVSYQYSQEMTHQYAVMRCIGLNGAKLRMAIVLPFVGFTLLAALLGIALGSIGHVVLIEGLKDIIVAELPLPSVKPFLMSLVTVLIVVLSFALPFLRSLVSTPPKQLLMPAEQRPIKLRNIFVFMGAGLWLLMQVNLQDIKLSTGVLLGLGILLILAYFGIQLLLKAVAKLSVNAMPQTQLSVKILHANKSMNSLQILAIAVTFFCLALVQTLRDDLLDTWQAKVPEKAPNFFAINLFEPDVEPFQQWLETQGSERSPVYPVVRGRLVTVNDEPVRTIVSKESQGDRATQRDLSLTWAGALPEDNVITQGEWHNGAGASGPEVSIEKELAESMGIGLGDELGFVANTRTFSAQVTSIREVDWESFAPNFYMMFDEATLGDFSATYLASFHLSSEQKNHISDLVKTFPNATFFDVDFLLNRIRTITQQVSFAIESILYFALLSSIVVFISIEMILHHSRLYTTAICKAVGAPVGLIQTLFSKQFMVIGLLSGLIAYTLNTVIGVFLAKVVLQSDYFFNLKTAVVCLVVAPSLVYLIGRWSISRTRDVSAKQLLNA